MNNNDVLRRLRFALDIVDRDLLELFDAAGVVATPDLLRGWMLREDDPEMIPCHDEALGGLLDAIIRKRRGPPPSDSSRPANPLSNNEVLKKLRIALALREADMIELLRRGGHPLSKAELGGLLRPPGHKHFRPCGDQFMRAFFRGLTEQRRGVLPDPGPAEPVNNEVQR